MGEVTMTDSQDDEQLTAKEIDARREAGLKKLLAMPHKPHKPEGSNQEQKKTVKVESERKRRTVDSVERPKKGPRRSGAK